MFILPGLSLGVLLLIFATFIPSKFILYKLPIQAIGVTILFLFLFEAGRFSEIRKYQKLQLQNNIKIEQEKVKSEQTNTETIIKYVDRIKLVDKIKNINTNDYISKEANTACNIDRDTSDKLSRLLNSSARGEVPNPPTNSNDSPK